MASQSGRGDGAGSLLPHLVGADGVRAVRSAADFDESWLQEVIFRNPGVLPISEIEPVFAGAVALAREMQTGRGPVDVVLMNGEGFPVLVETKLWGNPEARREVVAQTISYAAAMSGWSAEQFAEAAMRARRESGPAVRALNALMEDVEGFDERTFWERLTANLRRGRMLLIIAGDGIREGAHELTEALQAAPHLGFALSLVELPVYDLGSGQRLLVPRVAMRTTEIARHVIEVRAVPGPAAIVAVADPGEGGGRGRPRARDLTVSVYLEQLRAAAGAEAEEFVQWVMDRATASEQYYTTMSKNGLALSWRDESEAVRAKLIRFRRDGRIGSTENVMRACREHGLPESIAQVWSEGLVRLCGTGRLSEFGKSGLVRPTDSSGELLSFQPLTRRREDFWELVEQTASALEVAAAATRRPGQFGG